MNGTCFDKAGNGGLASLTLKYDATVPATTATPDREPNANGWYRASVTVTFAGNDATSGMDSCDAAKTYSGPDTQSTTLTGACRDKAGNESSASKTLKYDATAPQTTATPDHQPNANGWYKAAVTVAFAGTDVTSGMDACDPRRPTPALTAQTRASAGACLDKAGNVGASSYALKYDATAPQASATPSRQPNAKGWFNASVNVNFTATDAMSGFDSCPAPQTYSGPDTLLAVISGTCLDKAGNGGLASYSLKYDATAPVATAAATPQPNANGWNKSTVTVTFTGTDATSEIDSCDAAKTYSGPDTQSTTLSGTCRDNAGNVDSDSRTIKFDATAPVTTATPDRQPNANNWFNAPVVVSFGATDAMSGPEGCVVPETYSGPDSATASVGGTCLDKAGNQGSASYALKYDATAPQASATPSRQPNAKGWFNASLNVNFTATDAMSGFDSCPAPQTYSGPDTLLAVISGTCLDKAGNGGLASYSLKYDATAPVTTATPSPQPNGQGWNKSPVTLNFTGIDATAGIDSCDAPKNYPGPDTKSVKLSGSCTDKAGNVDNAERGAQVRRHSTGRHRRRSAAASGPRRLVQPPGRGRCGGEGHDVRPGRAVHVGDLLRAGWQQRSHLGPMRRHRRQRRVQVVLDRLRRHRATGCSICRPRAGRERLVQPLAGGRLHGQRRGLGPRVLRSA